MKINFKDENVFFNLEERAIDGTLIYDDFPPCEYKYFSKLAKLGYMNRHSGWSAEICEQQQAEIKKDYFAERERFDRFFAMACRMQESIKRGGMTVCEVNKSKTVFGKLKNALRAIELMTCEEGFAERNLKAVEVLKT